MTPTLVSTIDALTSTFGIGQLVKELSYQLGKTGVPVLVRRILPTTQAASIGALDLSEWTGDNPPTVTGTAAAYSKAIVEITTPGIASATGLVALVNEMRDDAIAHYALVSTVHLAADTTSGVGIGAAATDVPSAITLLGQLRAAELLHAASVVAHTAADTVSYASLPAAPTTAAEAVDFAVALKAARNTHVGTEGSVHGDADATNVTTAADAGDFAEGRYSLDGGDTFTTAATITGALALGSSGLTFTPGAGELDGSVTVQAYPASQAIVGLAITRSGTSTAVPSLSGTPLDRYEGCFEVLAGGTLGIATPAIRYRLSLDGRRTWQQEAGLGTAVTLPIRDGKEGLSSEEASGLTLTIGTSSQTLEVGDVITFETTPPAIAASDVVTALDDLRASAYGWEFVHVVGAVAGAAAATIGARFQSWAASAVGGARFTWGIWSTRQQYTGESDVDYDAAVADADYAALVNPRVSSWGGEGPRITCPITQRRNVRPVACVLVPELWSRPIEEDPMRVATGPLTSDIALYESGVRIAHDARADVALHAARFGTLRTYEEIPGVFVTRGSTFDVVNGEESRIPRRRVLDLSSTTFQRVLVVQLGDGVDRNADGTIDELEAQRLEEATIAELGTVLGGRASDFRVVVNRTTPLTPATPLSELVKILGLEYLDELNGTIGFVATLPEV